MFVTVMLLEPRLVALQQVAVQTAWLMAIFLPFSYFMDSFMYRATSAEAAAPRSAAPKPR